MMKGCVKTGNLGYIWKSMVECLGQQDFLRKVLRVEWTEAMQFFNHFRRDSLRLSVFRTTMDHTMPHCFKCIWA